MSGENEEDAWRDDDTPDASPCPDASPGPSPAPSAVGRVGVGGTGWMVRNLSPWADSMKVTSRSPTVCALARVS